jgi:hypothetical protein
MVPTAHIVHQLRGRLRLQVREKRKDVAYFDAARARIETIAEVDEVRINATTGSILLLHSLQDHGGLTEQLKQLALFEITEDRTPGITAKTGLDSVGTGLADIEQIIRRGTAGSVDLKTLAYVCMMGLTVHQIMRGQILGPAMPMLWDAIRLIDRIGSTSGDSRP